MKKNMRYPHWRTEFRNAKHFQQVKRAQVDAALEALATANLGCAWFPEYKKWKKGLSLIREVRLAMRRKEWKL